MRRRLSLILWLFIAKKPERYFLMSSPLSIRLEDIVSIDVLQDAIPDLQEMSSEAEVVTGENCISGVCGLE